MDYIQEFFENKADCSRYLEYIYRSSIERGEVVGRFENKF